MLNPTSLSSIRATRRETQQCLCETQPGLTKPAQHLTKPLRRRAVLRLYTTTHCKAPPSHYRTLLNRTLPSHNRTRPQHAWPYDTIAAPHRTEQRLCCSSRHQAWPSRAFAAPCLCQALPSSAVPLRHTTPRRVTKRGLAFVPPYQAMPLHSIAALNQTLLCPCYCFSSVNSNRPCPPLRH